jgi:glycosyltransferase involved in cell wall biosynthesis
MNPKLSVVIFTFNRASLLLKCIESVRRQSFQEFEIVISDNCSEDETETVVKRIDDPRVRYFRNHSNLGLRGNLEAGTSHCVGEIIFLMGDDDLLLEGALQRTWDAFECHPEVSMVTRPYYWFIDSPSVPVRAVKPFNTQRDTIVTVDSDRETLHALYQTAGQISGLAFRRQNIRLAYHPDIFTTHIYIFSDMLKQGGALLLKDYTVAVRINESMCRHSPEIYLKSPTKSWEEMFRTVFPGQRFHRVRSYGIDLMAAHCEGLVQIRSYGTFAQVIREIWIQIRSRPANFLSFKYLVYSALVLFFPRVFIIFLTEWYKRKILAKSIICDVRVV